MSTKGKGPYHHGDLRSSLILAGSRMIEEKGLARLSLREVARAAGVSHTAPYRHFQDKADLLAAIAQVSFEQLTDEAGTAARRYTDDPQKQLVATSVQYILFGVRHPRSGAVDFRWLPDPSGRHGTAGGNLGKTGMPAYLDRHSQAG